MPEFGSLRKKSAAWLKGWADSGNPKEPPPGVLTNKEFATNNNHFQEACKEARLSEPGLKVLPAHEHGGRRPSTKGFGGARQASKWRNGHGIARRYHKG